MKNNPKKDSALVATHPRFGVLDAVIVLLVVIAVTGIYFRFNILDLITQHRNEKEYTISYCIENIRYTTPNYLNVGDEVRFASDGEKFGVLLEESDTRSDIALSVTPASEYFTDNGKNFEVFYPNNESRVNARGRLSCKGTYSDEGGLLINGSTHITSGQSIAVQTDTVSVTLTILSIDLVEP